MGLCWGSFYATTARIYGYQHWATLLLLMSVAGIAAGATTSFAPNLAVLRSFLVALVGPSLLVTAGQTDGHAWAMGLLLSVYLTFSLIQGKRRNREYWRALSDRELLKVRAAELEKAKLAAEASSRAKSEFLANISHELRTPMNGVIGMTNLTLATELTPDQRDNLQAAKSSAESLLGLLNNLLDFTKIEAGKLTPEKIPFPLREILNTTVNPFRILAREKGVDLHLNIAQAVPDALVGDPERLRQILTNLIGNAVKFTERGHVRVSVQRIGGDGQHVELRFDVLDTGIGVPPGKREVIFDPFVQGDGSITRRFGGTGLGLTISARLTELIGGRIWFEGLKASRGRAAAFTCGPDSGLMPATLSPRMGIPGS
jgi:signal transduction histidine kinase